MATGKLQYNVSPYSRTTVTISNKNTPALLVKEGHVVWFNSTTDANGIDSGLNQVGTIPDGYRPRETLLVKIENLSSNQFVQFTYDGKINMYSPSAITTITNCAFNATWFTD